MDMKLLDRSKRISQRRHFFGWLSFALLFTIGLQNTMAQDEQKTDSLTQALNRTNDATEKAKIHNQLAHAYIPSDSAKVMEHANQAIEFSESSGYAAGKVKAWYYMGTAYRIRGYNEQAREWYTRSRDLSDSEQLAIDYANSLTGLGTLHSLKAERDQAMALYLEARAIYEKENNQEGQAMIYTELGITARETGNYDEAIGYYEQALAINLSLNKTDNVLRNYNNLANVYTATGDFALSVDYHLKSISMARDTGNKNAEAVGYSNIGQVYTQQGDFNKALEFYDKALVLATEVNNMREIALLKVKIGSAHLYSGNPAKALPLFEESAEIGKQLNSKRLIANAYNSMGDVYYRTGQHAQAIRYFEMTKDLYLEMGNRAQLSHLLIYMGDAFRRAGQFEQAKKHLEEGAEMAQETNYAAALRDAKLLLAYVEHDAGNHEASFWAHIAFKEVYDSLRNDEMTKNITRLEAEFDFQQERDSVAFAQERANLAFEEKLQRNRLVTQGAIGGGVLVTIILALLYRSYLTKQRKNNELRHKNEVIELQNNQLTVKNEEISNLRETEKQMAEEAISLKQRELATITMLSHEKNSLLEQLGDQIGQLSSKVTEDVIPDLKEIKRTIKTNLSQESWSMFMYQFEKVHPSFFKQLKERFSMLTAHDLRLSAYLKVGMDNKEIARVSNITTDAVKKSINRMKKKIDLAPDQDLRDFLIKL